MSIRRIDNPSPNHDERQTSIDMVVLHYTGMLTGKEAVDRLCDEAARVSAHYVVEEDGLVFSLVPEERRAWHAGVSHWQGLDGVNDVSVGIEIVNPGHEWGYRAFPTLQMDAVLQLVAEICDRWQVPPTRVIGHSDVAPERKEDPGEFFPWQRLAEAGLAVPPASEAEVAHVAVPDYFECLDMLKGIGYRLVDNQHAAPILAFQRHFIPSALGKGLDKTTRQALRIIHERFTNP